MELVNFLRPKEITKEEDVKFLNKFKQVDSAQLGNLLGQGYEYRVYEYGPDKVVKVPQKNFLYGNSADDVFYNYLIGREMFSEFVLPTDLIQLGEDYILVQKRLNKFRQFNKADLDDPVLRDQFEDLLTRNNLLLKRDLGALDLWGVQGIKDTLFKSLTLEPNSVVLDNVSVVEDENGNKRIYIPDFDLLVNQRKSESLKDVLVSNISFLLQKKLTRDFLGYEITDK